MMGDKNIFLCSWDEDVTPEQEPEELDGLLEDNNAKNNLTDPVKDEKDASLDIDEVS